MTKPKTKLLNFIKEEVIKNSNDKFFNAGERQRKERLLLRIADKINEVLE